jgi:hypothetical protein
MTGTGLTSLTYDKRSPSPSVCFLAYLIVKKPEYLEVAEDAMDFLTKTQMIDGYFVPIRNGRLVQTRREIDPIMDQQP